MKLRWTALALLGLAVIAAAYAYVQVSHNRVEAAQAEERRAQRLAEQAEDFRRAQEAEAQKALAAQRTADKEAAAAVANRQAKADERAARELEQENLKKQEKIAADRSAASRAQAAAEQDQRIAAEAQRDAEKARAAAALAQQKTAEAEAEQKRSEAAIKEADVYRLKTSEAELNQQKAQYAEATKELLALQTELQETIRMYQPDATANDSLTWVGEGEMEVIGETNSVRRLRERPLPEDDPKLPKAARVLARAERLATLQDQQLEVVVSNRIVTVYARLYQEALKADRVTDAQYYLQNIRLFYPNWEYKQ